jgi:hypothetical protein
MGRSVYLSKPYTRAVIPLAPFMPVVIDDESHSLKRRGLTLMPSFHASRKKAIGHGKGVEL